MCSETYVRWLKAAADHRHPQENAAIRAQLQPLVDPHDSQT